MLENLQREKLRDFTRRLNHIITAPIVNVKLNMHNRAHIFLTKSLRKVNFFLVFKWCQILVLIVLKFCGNILCESYFLSYNTHHLYVCTWNRFFFKSTYRVKSGLKIGVRKFHLQSQFIRGNVWFLENTGFVLPLDGNHRLALAPTSCKTVKITWYSIKV